ncbi:sodium channel modifier 1-like [Quillaja saponaria]|uniref:Sodium channel modifier 1 n=1 Tax=Quillaja saponaria TaxID=32244 RepID=A0AAD7M0H9_QUISA|nr:sodium channel modifier 1-like [Quillaja saponaria]
MICSWRVSMILYTRSSPSVYKKLSNGKYACVVCPNNPIFDSTLMLSVHNKGSRHCAAESRLKERELMKQNEINKRIALSDSSSSTSFSSSYSQKNRLSSKPLIEQTRKAASEILDNTLQKLEIENHDMKPITGQHSNFREHRERELKFTAAGWKHDGHGKWYRDENVEFDSDKEDPNDCLS